jgi:hypothetical protein
MPSILAVMHFRMILSWAFFGAPGGARRAQMRPRRVCQRRQCAARQELGRRRALEGARGEQRWPSVTVTLASVTATALPSAERRGTCTAERG